MDASFLNGTKESLVDSAVAGGSLGKAKENGLTQHTGVESPGVQERKLKL